MRVEVTVMVEIPPLYFPFEVNWFFLVHDDVYVKVRDLDLDLIKCNKTVPKILRL